MEKLIAYQNAIKAILTPFTEWTDLDPRTETLCVFDDNTGNYVVVQTGWEDGIRFYQPMVHVRLGDDRVFVLWNATDVDVERLLLEAGIPYANLVLKDEEPIQAS
jgi:uncharacterized secreted protein with C-terminal beta-propeller domain